MALMTQRGGCVPPVFEVLPDSAINLLQRRGCNALEGLADGDQTEIPLPVQCRVVAVPCNQCRAFNQAIAVFLNSIG